MTLAVAESGAVLSGAVSDGAGLNHSLWPGLLCRSRAMREVVSRARRYARLTPSVLVVGESGVGKELVARALHAFRDAGRPFEAVNAGALPPSLVDGELFGFERGAFTGAHARFRGVFERAHTGTLFLDELGELPLDLQVRLLRVLETRRVRRIGGTEWMHVQVRLVSATLKDLREEVLAGRFRPDLFHRVAGLTISVPPLRERREDILPLARYFLDQAEPEVGPRQLSKRAFGRLLEYDWPGNIRELRNVVYAAAVEATGMSVDLEHVDEALAYTLGECAAGPDLQELLTVVRRFDGNISRAARALGIPRTTLRDRIARAA